MQEQMYFHTPHYLCQFSALVRFLNSEKEKPPVFQGFGKNGQEVKMLPSFSLSSHFVSMVTKTESA